MQFKLIQRLVKEEFQPAYKTVEVWVDVSVDILPKFEFVGITSTMDAAKLLCKEFASSYKVEYLEL